jgi:hypothetical protein
LGVRAVVFCGGSRSGSRLAVGKDTNDAERLSVDPTMRHVIGGQAKERTAIAGTTRGNGGGPCG